MRRLASSLLYCLSDLQLRLQLRTSRVHPCSRSCRNADRSQTWGRPSPSRTTDPTQPHAASLGAATSSAHSRGGYECSLLVSVEPSNSHDMLWNRPMITFASCKEPARQVSSVMMIDNATEPASEPIVFSRLSRSSQPVTCVFHPYTHPGPLLPGWYTHAYNSLHVARSVP